MSAPYLFRDGATNEQPDYEQAEKYIVECATDWAESVVTGDGTEKGLIYVISRFRMTQ